MITPKGSPDASDRRVIQGLVARNYDRMKEVDHLVLTVTDKQAAAKFIGRCIPRVATVDDNGAKNCMNIGFTFAGLAALLDAKVCDAMTRRPELQAFVRGAAERAGLVGDVDASDPRVWKDGLGISSKDVHVLLSIYAENQSDFDEAGRAVKDAESNGFKVMSSNRGSQLPDGRIHFGYRDGISQPNIEGLRETGDNQPITPAGAFVLGYPSQFRGHTYAYDLPRQLGENGTFAVFRIMKQDVRGFEDYLHRVAGPGGNPELVAARICGRWRDGTPLVISEKIPTGNVSNNFEYAGKGDAVCPFSAHIRRTNPRDDRVAGLSGRKHRIVRSTMPYGPVYDQTVRDNHERGLIGLFLCANIADQFEFIMKSWVLRGGFNGNLPVNDSDPLIGFNSFVQTRGGAYCFMPSTVGLEYIASSGTMKSAGY